MLRSANLLHKYCTCCLFTWRLHLDNRVISLIQTDYENATDRKSKVTLKIHITFKPLTCQKVKLVSTLLQQ